MNTKKIGVSSTTIRRVPGAPVVVRVSLILLPLIFLTPRPADAYVDPGSGALMYQTMYAVCLGGFFYIRRLLDRVWSRRK